MSRTGGHKPAPEQLSLDDWYVVPQPPAPTAGSLDYANELCAVLSAALKECPLSRAEVAAKMSDLTGEEISLAMINAWTAPSHGRWRFPFEYAAAFEVATGTVTLQQLLASKRGSLVLIGRQAHDARLGQIERQMDRLKAERAVLRRGARHA